MINTLYSSFPEAKTVDLFSNSASAKFLAIIGSLGSCFYSGSVFFFYLILKKIILFNSYLRFLTIIITVILTLLFQILGLFLNQLNLVSFYIKQLILFSFMP